MRYLLHDVFMNSVKCSKYKIAIQEELGKSVTYFELNSLANQFANTFLKLKSSIKKYPFIGILSSVHINSVAAILGCLKIGCAYVPLDESSPDERLMHMVNNLELDLIVVDPVLYERHKLLLSNPILKHIILTHTNNKILFLDHLNIIDFDSVSIASKKEPETLNQVSDDLAYILHSSGSTGIPKGIMLTHRNARTFVDWMHKEFKITSKDIIMSRAPFKFDLSVFDIFNTFKAGGKLVCYNWRVHRDHDKRHRDYVRLMENEKATVLYTTPSTYVTLMHHGDLSKANLSLRTIMYAGEPFPIPHLQKLKKILPKTKIANIYGPTETNIITYYWINKIPKDGSQIPLGYVVDDTEIIIVSEDRSKICETNEIGELWCRGGTVTLGYLGLTEKTKDNLVISPFHSSPATFWRTGDFGFRDEAGILHYRGRRDHMIKINGYRIELGEIESSLAQYNSIDEFCVVVKNNNSSEKSIYCYYSTLTGKPIDNKAWRLFLETKLPRHMIPKEFIFKKVLPKTTSEKIDRAQLTSEAEGS